MFKRFIFIIGLIGAIILTPQVMHAQSVTGYIDSNAYNAGVQAGAAISSYKENIFVITLQDYLQDNGCWFCSAFAQIFKAVNTIATEMFTKLSLLAQLLLGFGLLFMIAFKIGRMVMQLQEVNLMQFLEDLFRPLGRAIIAMALLTATNWGGENIYSLLITPFLEIGLSLSSSIVLIIIT